MHAPLLLSVMLMLAACTTPAQPTPTPVSPVVQTLLVPQTVVVTAVPLATRAIQPSTPTVIPSLMANPTVTSAAVRGRPTPSGTPDPGTIPPSFFGMTAIKATDYPKVTFGTLGHPGIGAWAWIERQKGVYDFSLIDGFVNDAVNLGLADATNTVSMAITLGSTPE